MKGLVSLILVALIIAGCKRTDTRHRIIYVNSYHQGYPPSDEVMHAMFRNLPADTFDITSFFLDTKRKPDSVSVGFLVSEILKSVKSIDPELIIVSDDAAVKYLVAPYLAQLSRPVVYCGVNWSSDSYDLQDGQVTGMLEVLPLRETLAFLKTQNTDFRKLAVLSENSVSENQNTLLLDTLYRAMGFEPEYFLVDDFEAWKEKFRALNERFDVVYLPTNGAIAGWNEGDAREWARLHTQVPVFTCDDFMMPYAAVGFTKVAEEQGVYVARIAREILLSRKNISRMSEQRNNLHKVWINPGLVERSGLVLDDSLVNNAETYDTIAFDRKRYRH